MAAAELTEAQQLALFELIAMAVNGDTEVIRVELNNLKTDDGHTLGNWEVVVMKTAE